MGHGRAKKLGGGGTDAKDGESAEIEYRSGDGATLRVATLSWERRPDRPWAMSDADFRSTLHQVSPRIASDVDLLLCAGMSITSPPSAQEILLHTHGAPLAYEADGGAWYLAHIARGRATTTMLRRRQLVVEGWDAQARRGDTAGERARLRADGRATYEALATVIAGGAGVLTVRGLPTKLVLFICGENNVLKDSEHVVRVFGATHALSTIVAALAGSWIVLNPAHRPFWSQSRPRGFAIVGEVDGYAPIFARVVRKQPQLGQPTAPVAVVHCNNFHASQSATFPYSSTVFARSWAQPKRTRTQPQGTACPYIYDEWQVPVV